MDEVSEAGFNSFAKTEEDSSIFLSLAITELLDSYSRCLELTVRMISLGHTYVMYGMASVSALAHRHRVSLSLSLSRLI